MPTAHIEAEKCDIAKKVLMPGDPLRAKYIADNFLTDVKIVNKVSFIFSNFSCNLFDASFDKTIIETLDAIANNTVYIAIIIRDRFAVIPPNNRISASIGVTSNPNNPYNNDFGKFLTKSG